jgi:hypothetical protein
MNMVDVTMSMEEYLSLLSGSVSEPAIVATESMPVTKSKKRSTAYQRRYKSNFKKVANRFKLKNGKWKKNGFKSAVKLAHKMSRK